MDRNTLEWYDLLARGLLWAGAIVLLLSLIGAVIIAGSENAVGIAPEAEEQGRGFIALASLGGGIAAAGILAGMGALLRIGVAERLERLPAEGEGARRAQGARGDGAAEARAEAAEARSEAEEARGQERRAGPEARG